MDVKNFGVAMRWRGWNPRCPHLHLRQVQVSDIYRLLRSGMLRDPPNTTTKIWDAKWVVILSDLGEKSKSFDEFYDVLLFFK